LVPEYPDERAVDALPRSLDLGYPSHRPARLGLFAAVTFLAVVVAASATYVLVRSERPAAISPTVGVDMVQAKIAPAASPADNDPQKKPIEDRVDGAPTADKTKVAASGDDKIAVTASSSDDKSPLIVQPAGPAFDRPPKASGAPASPDHPVIGGDKAARGDGSGSAGSGAIRAAVPDATPAADTAATDADSRGRSQETQMDDVLNGRGSPIPVNADPLGIAGGKDTAGAVAGADQAPMRVGR
jgi:hypothetical protein